MFTGIITAIGRVAAVERRPGLTRLSVESAYAPDSVAIGASISHDGICLTIVERETSPAGMRHVVEAAAETLAKTTLGAWEEGAEINLERALRAGDELGGHFVTGHIDATAEVLAREADGEGVRFTFTSPPDIAALIAAKGSIAVNGVSLTINEVGASSFGVLVIPHTLSVTTLARLRAGDRVNLEADTLARYAQRILETKHGSNP
jgi:riboflavin synthase